jgi:hypothetical protein
MSAALPAMNDPLDVVQAFVEYAFLRMQADDVLARCLDAGSMVPLQQMVEELWLTHPQNLTAINEILHEARQHKMQVDDDLRQVYVGFHSSLRSYGIQLRGIHTVGALSRFSAARFTNVLDSQNITNTETRQACLNLLHESRLLLKNLSVQQRLLEEIERYLQEWLWGLWFEVMRGNSLPSSSL